MADVEQENTERPGDDEDSDENEGKYSITLYI